MLLHLRSILLAAPVSAETSPHVELKAGSVMALGGTTWKLGRNKAAEVLYEEMAAPVWLLSKSIAGWKLQREKGGSDNNF